MTLTFAHVTLAQRVLFGTGRAASNVVAEIERLGAHAVMVILSPRERATAQPLLSEIAPTLVWDEVSQHVPIENAERARAAADDAGVDLIVSIGGGSSTGLAKAIALTTGIPIVAVPTTYAGSEATNVWGMTAGKRKTTGVDDRVLPVSVVYDAALSQSLPSALTVASGLNALAHCIDGLWAPHADPINAALASEGIRALADALTAVHRDPADLAGREQCLYGAYLAAVAFASAGSGLHHKICHTLGGAYQLPHAQTHATVLPYVLAFNADAAPEAARRIAAALGASGGASGGGHGESAQDAVDALNALRKNLDAPHALRDYGFDVARIPEAVELILPAVPPSNPRKVTAANLAALLHDAWAGATPSRTGGNP